MRILLPASRCRTGLALTSLVFCGLVACDGPDPNGTYADYVSGFQDASQVPDTTPQPDATPDADRDSDGDVDEECDPAPFTPVGTWFLTVGAILDVSNPFYLSVNVTEQAGTYRFVLQPLYTDTDPRAGDAVRPERRQPVGDPIIVEGVTLGDDDSFVVSAPGLVFPAAANPITGSEVRGDVTLEGSFRQGNWACGAVTGQIVSPLTLNLNGSIFGLYRGDEDFVDIDPVRVRCDQAPEPPPLVCDDGGETPQVPECDDFAPAGTFLLAVSTLLDPSSPLLLGLDVIAQSDDLYTFSFQPLKTDMDGSQPRPDSRTPVGEPIVIEDVEIGSDGAFTVTANDLAIDGQANPITGGNILGDVTLTGSYRNNTFSCGAVTGSIRQPLTLNLAGSNYAFTRADDFSAVTNVPASCNAAPAPTDCDL